MSFLKKYYKEKKEEVIACILFIAIMSVGLLGFLFGKYLLPLLSPMEMNTVKFFIIGILVILGIFNFVGQQRK